MSGYSEARLQRRVGRVVLSVGVVTLPFGAALSWLVTRDYPTAWRIEWYDVMFLRFPDNTGALIAAIMIIVGSVILVRARHTARILSSGIAAPATVIEVTDTGTRVNHQPKLTLRLVIAPPGEQPYELTVKRVVPAVLAPRLLAGLPVPVRIDPARRHRVVLDWAAVAQMPNRPSTAMPGGGAAGPGGWLPPAGPAQVTTHGGTPYLPDLPHVTATPTSREDLKVQIRAVGMPGTALLTAVIPLPPVDERRLYRMDLAVRLDNGASYLEHGQAVPVDDVHAAKAIAGTQVPIRVALVDHVAVTLFEWERI